MAGFSSLDITTLLYNDPRPTFVLDESLVLDDGLLPFRPELCNTALRSKPELYNLLFGSTSPKLRRDLHQWRLNPNGTYESHGLVWHCFRLLGRWAVISVVGGNLITFPDGPKEAVEGQAAQLREARVVSGDLFKLRSRDDPSIDVIAFDQFISDFDWASTPLGHPDNWAPELSHLWEIVKKDPRPSLILWGENLNMIYNEEEVKSMFADCMTAGKSIRHEEQCFFLLRSGRMEETFWSFSLIPILDNSGKALGVYEPVNELTQEIIIRRRLTLLLTMTQHAQGATTSRDFFRRVLQAFESEKNSVPFAVLYTLNVTGDAEGETLEQKLLLHLEGTMGISASTHLDQSLELNQDSTGYAGAMMKSLRSRKPQLVQAEDGSLPEEIVQAVDGERGFGDRCDRAMMFPMGQQGKQCRALLVFGLNPRRPFDAGLEIFTNLLGRQLSNSLASIMLNEEAIRRGNNSVKQAAYDKALLNEEVLKQAREKKDAETRFSRFTELAPVGIFLLGQDGAPLYANSKYYELLGLERGTVGPMGWMASIYDEDIPKITEVFTRCMQDQLPIDVEFRTKVPWNDPGNQSISEEYTTILASAYPEVSDEGVLLFAFGVMTNISQQKWTQKQFGVRAAEALEAKRQQENFVDMTSHEIRNPLNAIVQCADGIINGLAPLMTDKRYAEIIQDSISNAETIAYCAQHQKRVVDDILTLSKLDSNLLSIAPIAAQPRQILAHALRMFEVQAQKADIQLSFSHEPSLAQLEIDWAHFDPSRVLQIIINLVTNSLKFTAPEAERRVMVRVGASLTSPSLQSSNSMKWFPSRKSRTIPSADGSPHVASDEFYLLFSVEDTGRGLTPSEQNLLFERFSQASPRTYSSYGGSGLGLFISRELTEMQGGEIGLDPTSRQGSLFAFYIKTRRVPPPAAPSDLHGYPSVAGPSVSPGLEAALQSPPMVQDADMSGISILLVEDNVVNQRVLAKQLQRICRDVQTANHGIEALDVIRASSLWREDADHAPRRRDISVILLDVEMPVMDGLTCVRKIRLLQAQGHISRHVPIIATTANARIEQIDEAREAGMDDVLSKPFRIPELVAKVQQVLSRTK